MKLFKVPVPARVMVFKTEEWEAQNMQAARNMSTRKENVFELEDMVLDPLNPQKVDGTVWEVYAKTGWYAFKRDNYIMLVPGSRVEIM
jgi:hypothetical protein